MPSTVIRSFRYDALNAELSIVFRSGRRYVYSEVPEHTYRAMQASFSKGTFFNAHIRDRFHFVETAQDDVE
jgi:KTSC domain